MGFYGVQMHPLGLLFPFKIWVQEVLWVITDPGLILIGWLILLPSTPLSLPPPPFLLPSLSLLALAVKNIVLAFSIPGILIEILSALGNSLFVFCLFVSTQNPQNLSSIWVPTTGTLLWRHLHALGCQLWLQKGKLGTAQG